MIHRCLKSIIAISVFWNMLYSQGYSIDSLKSVIQKLKNDSNKVKTLNLLAIQIFENNPDTAVVISKHALDISKKIQWVSGIAHSQNCIGNFYLSMGNYSESLKYFVYAIENYKTLKDDISMATILSNIGNLYSHQNNYNKALSYYSEALNIINKYPDEKKLKMSILMSIGIVYEYKNMYDLSIKYFHNAIELAKDLNNDIYIAMIYSNMGNLYENMRDFPKSIEYLKKSLKIAEKNDNKYGMAINYGNLGKLYFRISNFALSEKYFKQALTIDYEINALEQIMIDELHISQLYDTLSQLKQFSLEHRFRYLQLSKEHFKKHLIALDSIKNEKNIEEQTRIETRYEIEKEHAKIKLEQEKKELIAKEENKRKTMIIYGISAGLVIIALFLIFVVKSLKITQKQKILIEKQKKQVEEKNKDILDSITYAKRIQDAILPDKNKWQLLLPNSFVLYLPKDIIAGDFYWLEETNNYVFVAAADCTGHGVPGAMVSVVCSNALTKCVLEEQLVNTDAILNRTNEIIIEKLSSSEQHLRDGMDICLIRIDKQHRMNIQYSGANRPLVIVRNNEIIKINPDKQPIGWMEDRYSFTASYITLQTNDNLYLYTDGFADQFGGKKGKKMGNNQLLEKLKTISKLSADEQIKHLHPFFLEWKGEDLQTDDVTIIGICV